MISLGLGQFEQVNGEIEINDIADSDYNFNYKSLYSPTGNKLKEAIMKIQGDIEEAIRKTFNKRRDEEKK